MSEYFVDFEGVWLSYNEELLKKGEYAIARGKADGSGY